MLNRVIRETVGGFSGAKAPDTLEENGLLFPLKAKQEIPVTAMDVIGLIDQ